MKFSFIHFELDSDLFELRYKDEVVEMEPQAYNALLYLLENRNRVVFRQELLDDLWAGRVVSESSLGTCIKAVRKAVHDTGRSQNTIATIHGQGYRFIAEVKEIPQSNEVAAPAKASLAIDSSCLTQNDDRLSLVVLPFSSNPGDTESAWWAEVFSEDISIHLARISGFMVISRDSAMTLGKKSNARDIGQALGTRYVIDGSVRNFKQEYRISVQLIDATNGQLLWASRKHLATENIHAFQADVVQKVVAQIEPELNRAELSVFQHRKPVDMGAWARCREATALLAQKGWSEETFAEVAALLRNAIQLDPELAFAHAYLSLIIALGHLIGLVRQTDWKQEATLAAETALSLDAQDSDVLGHVGCAFADMGDYHRGIPLMKRAIEVHPGNAQAWAAMGAAKLRTGDESGVEDMRHGLRISPKDSRAAPWGALLAQGLLAFNRIEEAIDAARNACRDDDKIYLPRVILTIALSLQGKQQEAQIVWLDAKRIRPQLSMKDVRCLAGSAAVSTLKTVGVS